MNNQQIGKYAQIPTVTANNFHLPTSVTVHISPKHMLTLIRIDTSNKTVCNQHNIHILIP